MLLCLDETSARVTKFNTERSLSIAGTGERTGPTGESCRGKPGSDARMF
jgi:hypothetical protein